MTRLLELKQGHRISSKHPQIYREMRQKIISGVYQERIPSLRNLAKEYQANVRTISKAVSALAKEGLLVQGRRNLGFRIRAENRTFSIGLIASRTKEYFLEPGDYYSSIYYGVNKVIHEKRAIFSYQYRDNKVSGYRSMFHNLNLVDGLLIFLPFLSYKRELIELGREKFPFVVVGSTFKEPEINYVDSNNVGDSCMAVESLLAHGHRRIAMLNAELPEKTDPEEKLQGYKEVLKKHKVAFDPELVFMGNDPKEAGRFLSLRNQPTALFGTSTGSTGYFLSRLKEKAPNILKKLSLVVYDDHQNECRAFGIPYSVVKQPLEEMGRVATQKLLGLIKGNSASVKINLSSTLLHKKISKIGIFWESEKSFYLREDHKQERR